MHRVLLDLATQIVRDGEGASKIIEITVEGAAVMLPPRSSPVRSPTLRW